MSQFLLRGVRVENYRCFEALELPLEDDATVLFAENGGGKTALLDALAMGLAAYQRGVPRTLRLDAERDPRMVTLDEGARREPAGQCGIAWTAAVGEMQAVEWSTTLHSTSRRTTRRYGAALDAIEQVRVPGERWPLFARYGVDRLRRVARPRTVLAGDRREGYAGALDASLDEAPLRQWLQDEFLGDVARREQRQPERRFHTAVMEAAVQATPGVASAWYDPVTRGPVVRFEDGHAAPWSALSDGCHVFIALVADIARRAVMLNEMDGAEAPARVEGVVLIDALDLHLHPRWQRVALQGLRRAFPRMQLVVGTHSPQVLSSAENRQVRRLVGGRLQEERVFVEGRDTNAILREYMHTDDRDSEGARKLRKLHDCIDDGRREDAEQLYRELLGRWGDLDPDLIRARVFLDLEE